MDSFWQQNITIYGSNQLIVCFASVLPQEIAGGNKSSFFKKMCVYAASWLLFFCARKF